MRVLRRVLPLAVILFVVAAIAMVLSTRPALHDKRADVDARWDALAGPLDTRYDQLAAAADAVRNAPGSIGDLVGQIDDAKRTWDRQRERGSGVESQVKAANTLEGLGRRLVTTVRASARLNGDPAVKSAVDTFANAAAPEPLPRFDAAVRAYEDKRGGPLRRTVAAILGYDSIPSLQLHAAPA
jgi:hypothetical protein